MSNFQIMYDFQHFPFGQKFIELPFCSICIEPTGTSFYENYALVEHELTKEQVEKIESELNKMDRVSSITFEDTPSHSKNITLLKSLGYSHDWHDSWLFYETTITDASLFDKIITVTTEEELEVFLDTFNKCYQKNDPQNPYGEVANYLTGTKNRWLHYGKDGAVKYFIAYDEAEPVAVAALTSYKGLGYISAVGSLQKVRGKGFGKKVSLYAVYTSQQMGNTKHFLLTEVGTHPYEFYKGIGFVEKFTATGMYK